MSKRGAITTKKTTQAALMRKVERNPNRYRVGATNDIATRVSAYEGKGKYGGSTMYYARSKIPKVKEDNMLSHLPKNHRNNDQKVSNYHGGPGYVYVIDTKSKK